MRLVRNHGMAGGVIADEKLGAPVEPIIILEHCDVDQACDYAKYEIHVGGDVLFDDGRRLYFCSHHYHALKPILDDRGYGVRKL